ncbi:MAG TPA: glutamate 5-kinase, partial [Gaiellaceae bacterium]|nr:glutamate 5-kinase [Gaiellaceae bacterium]
MRIVVKLGSSLVATPKGAVRRGLLGARAREVAELLASGHSVCIVSSGAIALGGPRLGFARRPVAMRQLQAASAVGQAQLQQAWERALARAGLQAAQILLSPADVGDRQTYVNVCNTFDALFRLGTVPVVNENDATATDEITFGDNDSLAAQVAVLTNARLLVLLTEVDGVYSRAPGTPGAELLDDGSLTADVRLGRGTGLGRGGMGSKITAARLAAGAGIPTVIASGRAESVLVPIVAGERRGTRFDGGASPGESA